MAQTIEVYLSEEDLQDLQNGKTFNWTYQTLETDSAINVMLTSGNSEE